MRSGAQRRVGAVAVAAALLPALLVACGDSSGESSTAESGTGTLPQSSEPSNLNPADFSTQIDNPYWPMPVGARWEVRVTNPEGELLHEVITVENRTKLIADGVTARVVHDVVYDHGKASEITDDWYAQDSEGNVWYFGEDTASIQNGKRDTSGSFEAGAPFGGLDLSGGVLRGARRGSERGARAGSAGRGAGRSLHRRDPDR